MVRFYLHRHLLLLRYSPLRPKDSIDPPPPRRLRHIVFSHSSAHLLRPTKLTTLFLLFSLVYLTLIFYPRLLFTPSPPPTLCSSLPNNSICCDTSGFRSDVCFMRGDVRTHSPSNSLLLHNTTTPTDQTIRPYTRKWEPTTMATIDELHLRAGTAAACDVHHSVPAVVFSTGGYTGNVYHEFNDGLLPLYITVQHLNRRVVLVILEYHDWWITKYKDVLSQLSDFPAIDFSGDRRVHCFLEAIVGLRIHDELSIDPSQMVDNKSILDFRKILDEAYRPRIRAVVAEEMKLQMEEVKMVQPKLVIISRNGSRAMENEIEVAALATEVGFKVEKLHPTPTMELAKIYRVLNECDAMVGVHGAGMTHFLFMRPGKVFIQVVPLGTEWAAEAYYGTPAAKMGLKYIRYQVTAQESSLYREYPRDDKVLRDPKSVNAKGWEVTKRVYLDGQKVKLDLGRFRRRLVRAHLYLTKKKLKQMMRKAA